MIVVNLNWPALIGEFPAVRAVILEENLLLCLVACTIERGVRDPQMPS
jgi:hypothetical protein